MNAIQSFILLISKEAIVSMLGKWFECSVRKLLIIIIIMFKSILLMWICMKSVLTFSGQSHYSLRIRGRTMGTMGIAYTHISA